MDDHSTRLERAYESLEAVAVGDAFGELFNGNPTMRAAGLDGRRLGPEDLPPHPWAWTDDTNMASSVFENLRRFQNLDQSALSRSFAQHYHRFRNYSSAMAKVMQRIRAGEDWKVLSIARYDGQGSYGIDAAARVIPIGAYFADDIEQAVAVAEQSAEVTHTHVDGVSGAIAIAVAVGVSWQYRQKMTPSRAQFINEVLGYLPDGRIKEKVSQARDVAEATPIDTAMKVLGDASESTMIDTVPLALFIAADTLGDFESALWRAAAATNDSDTMCALVAGVVVGCSTSNIIPKLWRDRTEPLPLWATTDEASV